MNRRDELRSNALRDLREHEVLMLTGHFDYGNGFHGSVYLNPHRIFRHPSLIWRLAQDLIEVLPDQIVGSTDVVAGPVMGGALLAHTIAGLMDGRRALTHPPTSFAPLSLDANGRLSLRSFYRSVVEGKRVLLADDVRNTGETFARAKGRHRGGRWHGDRYRRNLRPPRGHRGCRRTEFCADGVQGARQSPGGQLPVVPVRRSSHEVLMTQARPTRLAGAARGDGVLAALDRLYSSFNHPESALDPIQIVRRYSRADDREVVGFIAAGLAFGRVASVMASIESVCAVLGPAPAAFVRSFDPDRDSGGLRPLVHRWTRGEDLAGLILILRDLLAADGSLERAFARD
jgi:hypothetical protein